MARHPGEDRSRVEVQIFGVKKSADTRKALRFFAERRIKTHFVDFEERTIALGELKRFVQKFGLDGILDRDGKVYAEMGLKYANYSEQRMLEKVMDELGYEKFRVGKTPELELTGLQRIDQIPVHSDLSHCDYVLSPREASLNDRLTGVAF